MCQRSDPPPPSSSSCMLYSVIQQWLIRVSDTRVSAHLCGKEGTHSPLILTVAPTKGIFLTSRKHSFLIRDGRPISQKHKAAAVVKGLAHVQPQTLNSWLWAYNHTSRHDVVCELRRHIHKDFNPLVPKKYSWYDKEKCQIGQKLLNLVQKISNITTLNFLDHEKNHTCINTQSQDFWINE